MDREAADDARASQGDASSFEDFYRDNYANALRVVVARTDGCDAEALVADAFVVVWSSFLATGVLSRAWFFKVLRNKIGDHYRASRREWTSSGEVRAERADDPVSSSADALVTRQVLRSIRDVYAEALVLVYWADMTGPAAAEAAGVSEAAFRIRLMRARRAFHKAYEKAGGLDDGHGLQQAP